MASSCAQTASLFAIVTHYSQLSQQKLTLIYWYANGTPYVFVGINMCTSGLALKETLRCKKWEKGQT